MKKTMHIVELHDGFMIVCMQTQSLSYWLGKTQGSFKKSMKQSNMRSMMRTASTSKQQTIS